MPTPRTGGYRHLIYFVDGTWLWAGSQNTLDVYSNVYLMNTLLKVDDDTGHAQIFHYSRGLGAVGGLRRYIDGGFANGIDALIADVYVNICSNYQPGDRIYIFGFSRGAVVARALTGLIGKGILDDDHINMFGYIWADYVGENEVLEPGFRDDGPRKKRENIPDYKAFLSDPEPKIEFLGVFETVAGGWGLTSNAQRLRLEERKLPTYVKNAVHVLAIDETRNYFRQIMWTGADGHSSLEQIWMPGVHSDVGGAYAIRTLGNIALITMIDRVIAKTGLNFDLSRCREYNRKLSADFLRIHNERALRYWRFLSPWPVARCINRLIKEQSIHPLAIFLDDKPIQYKKRLGHIYRLSPDCKGLGVAPEFLTKQFQTIF
jgi:uncharacterized protein (DUF2235 family)